MIFMNKMQAIDIYAENYGVTKVQAKAELERVIEFISDALAAGEEFQVIGFGTFYTKTKEAHTARNPQDGSQVQVDACIVPKFKASKVLKEKCNANS
jgi:DNA-binding protein HU-beta